MDGGWGECMEGGVNGWRMGEWMEGGVNGWRVE